MATTLLRPEGARLGQPVIYVENDAQFLGFVLEAQEPSNPDSRVDLLVYQRGRGWREETQVPATTGPRRWVRPELLPGGVGTAKRPKEGSP